MALSPAEAIVGAARADPGLLRPPVFESQARESAAPLPELRRRCDTSTNFQYNQNQ
jgi:hypothetical protein